MTFSVSFNGVDISSLVNGFTGVTRNIGSAWVNTTFKTSNTGVDFLYNSIDAKTITISFIAHVRKDRFSTTRRELAKLLNVSKPAPLIIGDEPNIVWYAVPDGSQTLDESSFFDGIGTLTFLVPSGTAISSYTQELNNDNSGGVNGSLLNNEDGSITVNINNQGTIETYPQVKITHTSDNGFIGLVSPQSIVQLGSIDETLITNKTTETVKYKSAWLLNGKRSQAANFSSFANSNDTNPQNSGLKTAGTISFLNDGLRLTSMGTPPVYGSYLTMGGLKKYKIPADENNESGSKYFSSYFNILAWAGKMGQTGLLQVLYMTSDNKMICGFGIYKDDSKGNRTNAQFYVGGNRQRTFHTFKFPANNAESNQKSNNKNKNFNTSKGGVTISKKAGGKLKWSLTDTSQSLVVPELENSKVFYIYVYIGQIKGRNLGFNQFMSNLVLRELSFRKDDVARYFDSTVDVESLIPGNPHHYGKGETLLIDMESAKIFKKDGSIPGNDELITGSEFFSIPPGTSSFDLIFSDEMETLPIVDITWKERFL